MTLSAIFNTLRSKDIRFKVDVTDAGDFRATLGTPVEWVSECASLRDIEAVEEFFREQVAIHFPGVDL